MLRRWIFSHWFEWSQAAQPFDALEAWGFALRATAPQVALRAEPPQVARSGPTGHALTIVPVVNPQFLGLVTELSHRGFQEFRCNRDVAAGIFQCVDEHFSLEVFDSLLQGQGG